MHFEPYKLREFYKPDETPQVIVEDDTVFCKHGHASAESIEEKIKIRSTKLSNLFATVKVEMEYLQKMLEKNKDERAIFALSKLVRQEQSLLSRVASICNVFIPFQVEVLKRQVLGLFNFDLSEEEHKDCLEKDKSDEELSVFKMRTKIEMTPGDFFNIEIDSSSNPRILRFDLFQKSSDYCALYSHLKGEMKTLESLQNSKHFYAQLNCQSEEEREGVELGIAMIRKAIELKLNILEECKATFLAGFVNQTAVAKFRKLQVAGPQFPGHTVPQIPSAQNGQPVSANSEFIPQPPRPSLPPPILPQSAQEAARSESRSKKRKGDAVNQPEPQSVTNEIKESVLDKVSQTTTPELKGPPKKRKPNPEPSESFNMDDAAQLLAQFSTDTDN